jgi:predicted HNH restriction endonuclease
VCGETDPTRFYGKKKQICGRCDNQYTVERGRQISARARAELGGRCMLCGFDKYHVSLDLHHLDAREKDPNFARKRGWSWERVEKELKKCVLLCKNCHTAVHAGLTQAPDTPVC